MATIAEKLNLTCTLKNESTMVCENEKGESFEFNIGKKSLSDDEIEDFMIQTMQKANFSRRSAIDFAYYLLSLVVVFIIGGVTYGSSLEMDYGSPGMNFVMAGLRFVVFYWVCGLLFVGSVIPVLGEFIIWRWDTIAWALDVANLPNTSFVSNLFYWVAVSVGFVFNVIISVVIVSYLLVGIISVTESMQRSRKSKKKINALNEEDEEDEEETGPIIGSDEESADLDD